METNPIAFTATNVLGSAADFATLEKAGICDTPAVVITTHDDDTNVYLTLYCRKLRPDVQIISRATLERNVSTLHRAGADFVLSYASMGATMIFNVLRRTDILVIAGSARAESEVPQAWSARLSRSGLPRETHACLCVRTMVTEHDPGRVV